MSSDIRNFFESYRNAFNLLDGEAIAKLYAIPSGIASDTGYEHWSRYEPIRENMVALCKLYGENGYVRASFEPESFIQQGEQYAIADLRWQIGWWRIGEHVESRLRDHYAGVPTACLESVRLK